MSPAVQGSLEGRGLRVALVASRFNEPVTEQLVRGARDCLARLGCEEPAVYRVPGAWEIPPVARRLAEADGIDGVVTLGALIRGETPHFDVLAAAVSQSLARLALDARVPVIFGVLTTDTAEQALARCAAQGDDGGADDAAGHAAADAGAPRNKGWEAARCAVEMINLYRRMA